MNLHGMQSADVAKIRRIIAAAKAVVVRDTQMAAAEHTSRSWLTPPPDAKEGRPAWWGRMSPQMQELTEAVEAVGIWTPDPVNGGTTGED